LHKLANEFKLANFTRKRKLPQILETLDSMTNWKRKQGWNVNMKKIQTFRFLVCVPNSHGSEGDVVAWVCEYGDEN